MLNKYNARDLYQPLQTRGIPTRDSSPNLSRGVVGVLHGLKPANPNPVQASMTYINTGIVRRIPLTPTTVGIPPRLLGWVCQSTLPPKNFSPTSAATEPNLVGPCQNVCAYVGGGVKISLTWGHLSVGKSAQNLISLNSLRPSPMIYRPKKFDQRALTFGAHADEQASERQVTKT